MKNYSHITREKYLSFLQSLYGNQIQQFSVDNTVQLQASMAESIKKKGFSGDDANRLLEHALQGLEVQSGKFNQFVTGDNYVRREADKILTAFGNENRQDITENVTFGTLPLPNLDGMCLKVPDGGYLVLINFGVFALFEVVSNVLSGLIHFKVDGKETQPGFSHVRAAGYLIDFVSAFPDISQSLANRYSEFYHVYETVDSPRGYFCSTLGDTLINFIIAHEISHFVRGHVNEVQCRHILMDHPGSDQVTVEATQYGRFQEHEADTLGAAILVLGTENSASEYSKYDAMIAELASQVFFLVLELMENLKGMKSFTHPSATERREHLLKKVEYEDEVIGIVSFLQNAIFSKANMLNSNRTDAIKLIESAELSTAAGNFLQAADQLDKAANLAKTNGIVDLEVNSRRLRADALMKLRQYSSSIKDYLQVIELVGDLRSIKDGDDVYVQAAIAYSETGELEKAINFLNNAITIVRERGEKKWEGNYLHSLGLMYAKLENYWEALRCFSQSLAILKKLGEQEDQTRIDFLHEAIIRIKAELMEQIHQSKDDRNAKLRKMAELMSI
jgi:tetratricopeptide (TPR) repeat protein